RRFSDYYTQDHCSSPVVSDLRCFSSSPSSSRRRIPASQPRIPPTKSSIAVLSSRLFFERSPSAETPKGFFIVGLTVTARKSCSNSAASWSDVPDQLTQPLSLLHDGRFRSRRPLQRQITEPLHGKPTI